MKLQVFVSAMRNAGVLQIGSLAFLSALISACVYVPPVWDVHDEIGYVGSIKEGVTTKKEVVQTLGEPDFVNKEKNTISYHGISSAGAMCIAAGYYHGGCGLIEEEPWWILIYFDEDNVVSGLASSEEPGGARHEEARRRQKEIDQITAQAGMGEAEAQYKLAQESDWKSAEGWVWYCRAANQNHSAAQYALGSMRSVGSEDVPADAIKAYFWYSLAMSNGHRFAEWRRTEVAQQMTPTEIAEAERLVREWKPDPTSCEIETARARS